MSSERLPSLPLPPPGQAYSSGTSSPRVSSIGSLNGSQSSFTSATSSIGPKTPSPTLPVNAITGPSTSISSYDAMNQPEQPLYYPQHMSAGPGPSNQTVTSGGMSHYPQHQPPLLQPGPAQYSAPAPYSQYGYANGLTSPPTAPPSVSNPMGGQNVLPLPGVGAQGQMQSGYQGFDTTGQQPPPGMKPRVTATLWEDEGSLCFQVEARGICVARREDNHMINGTKLLNVAGMTRGRRDGILKSEKVRHVVKIGPMHLKGVWIPYDRALDFANKEKITEMLYPLFVHNIGALLYHPTNQSRTTQVMAAAERRKQEQNQMRNPGPPGLPSIGQHHPSMALPGPQNSLPSHNNMGRPSLDRAHTFPTPPTSASSVMGSMGTSESFNWQGQGMSGPQGNNPMTIDTGLSNARSMPTTPATTPPGPSLQSMHSYPSAAQQYDNTRPMYNTQSSQQSPYQTSNAGPQDRMYAQPPNAYSKNEMGPPSSRPSISGPSGEQHDPKPSNGLIHSDQAAQPQNGEDENEHEHDAEYTHDSSAYDGSRNNYNYTAPGVGTLANETNLSPEMTGSPSHPAPSGRATPRSAAPPQPYYPQHAGYNTPPRVQQTTSNLYNVMSNDRGTANGAPGNDVYAPSADMSGMPNGYAPQPPVMNGSGGVLKRGREDDDDISRSSGDGPGSMGNLDLKRRKTMMESTVPAPSYDAMNRPTSAIAAPRRR
ncbi:hypothetical protein QQX98_005946 [Neonectria punicea]|uniref:HTH APSES-type domain-containing protein n=1 Tax=Neonectria punicea TaxID=979145 RepID=A0ABR1H2T8_9HYPO